MQHIAKEGLHMNCNTNKQTKNYNWTASRHGEGWTVGQTPVSGGICNNPQGIVTACSKGDERANAASPSPRVLSPNPFCPSSSVFCWRSVLPFTGKQLSWKWQNFAACRHCPSADEWRSHTMPLASLAWGCAGVIGLQIVNESCALTVRARVFRWDKWPLLSPRLLMKMTRKQNENRAINCPLSLGWIRQNSSEVSKITWL